MTLAISDLTLAKSITDLNPCQSRQVIGGMTPQQAQAMIPGLNLGINWTSIKVDTDQQIITNVSGTNFNAKGDITYETIVVPG